MPVRCLLEADQTCVLVGDDFQSAYDHLLRTTDLAGYTVTLQATVPVIGDELHAIGHPGCGGKVVLIAPEWRNGYVYAAHGARLHVKSTVLNNTPIHAGFGGMIEFNGPSAPEDAVTFGECDRCHIEARDGGRVTGVGHYKITGGATYHVHATEGGRVQITTGGGWLEGTPHFRQAFVGLATNASATWGQDFAYHGAAVGQRFYVHKGSVLDTQRQGTPDYLHFLPGNVDGVTVVGVSSGWYT